MSLCWVCSQRYLNMSPYNVNNYLKQETRWNNVCKCGRRKTAKHRICGSRCYNSLGCVRETSTASFTKVTPQRLSQAPDDPRSLIFYWSAILTSFTSRPSTSQPGRWVDVLTSSQQRRTCQLAWRMKATAAPPCVCAARGLNTYPHADFVIRVTVPSNSNGLWITDVYLQVIAGGPVSVRQVLGLGIQPASVGHRGICHGVGWWFLDDQRRIKPTKCTAIS